MLPLWLKKKGRLELSALTSVFSSVETIMNALATPSMPLHFPNKSLGQLLYGSGGAINLSPTHG